jgi:hypothetical protein
MPLHLAYGSNMWCALMRQHCPQARPLGHRDAYSSPIHRDGGRLCVDRPAAGAQGSYLFDTSGKGHELGRDNFHLGNVGVGRDRLLDA